MPSKLCCKHTIDQNPTLNGKKRTRGTESSDTKSVSVVRLLYPLNVDKKVENNQCSFKNNWCSI